MGLLTGKFRGGEVKIPANDVRHDWDLKEGRIAEIIQNVEALREVFTSGGRTPAQGALGWLWARSDCTIPIPGFKTVEQVKENAGAMQFGPLTPAQMEEIDRLLGR